MYNEINSILFVEILVDISINRLEPTSDYYFDNLVPWLLHSLGHKLT